MFDPAKIEWDCVFCIEGQAASKSNSRRLVWTNGKPRSVKSEKAMAFVAAIRAQCKPLPVLLTGNLLLWSDVWYPSRRQDLDTTLVEDGLQGIAFENDRQITMNFGRKFIDRTHPRVIARLKMIGVQTQPQDWIKPSGLVRRHVAPAQVIEPKDDGDLPF